MDDGSWNCFFHQVNHQLHTLIECICYNKMDAIVLLSISRTHKDIIIIIICRLFKV